MMLYNRKSLQGYRNQLSGLLSTDRTGSEIVVHRATVEALVEIIEAQIVIVSLIQPTK